MPGRVLARYLAGDWPGAGGIELDELELVREPLLPERRVGLARDAGHQARTGFFYQSTHLRPDGDWAFLAECAFKPEWQHQADGTVSFGGRGRLADVAPARAGWPVAAGGSVKNRVLVYLATPALWPDGWRIPVPDGAHLIAAATGEPEPTATITPGEDWARTRMLRWAVPAGSVYLLEFDDAGPRRRVGAVRCMAPRTGRRITDGKTAADRGVRGRADGSVDVTELLLYLYAESPVHTGAADSVDVLDLPVQREAATGYPVIWGQSLKGALRQAARDAGWDPGMITSVFGSDVAEAAAGGSTTPGGLAVGDAQLVAMPVPALRRTFAWVTSEIALGRLARKYRALDLEVPAVPEVRTGEGVAATAAWTDAPSEVLGPCVLPLGNAANDRLARWAARLAEDALGAGAGFTPFAAKLGRDLIMAGSDVMPVLLRECTEQSVRVQLAAESKTVENGPFYSEYLPAETILAAALTLRRGADDAAARAALGRLLNGQLLQVGGDETLGKGLVWGRLIGLPVMTAQRVDQGMAAVAARLLPVPVTDQQRTRYRQLRVMLHVAGLAATYAFIAAKSGEQNALAGAYQKAGEGIAQRLSGLGLLSAEWRQLSPVNVLAELGEMSPVQYARACAEAQALVSWLSRLADAMVQSARNGGDGTGPRQ